MAAGRVLIKKFRQAPDSREMGEEIGGWPGSHALVDSLTPGVIISVQRALRKLYKIVILSGFSSGQQRG